MKNSREYIALCVSFSLLRLSHVVKRVMPHCVACLLLFAAVFVCFSVVVLSFVCSSAQSAGAQTQFIHARCALSAPRYCTAMRASTRGVNNCAPLPQMSTQAFRVRKNSSFSSAFSEASTSAPLIILPLRVSAQMFGVGVNFAEQENDAVFAANAITLPYSTAASNDAAKLNARARFNARALNMLCGSVSRGRKYSFLCHLVLFGHGSDLLASICAFGAFIYSPVIVNMILCISKTTILILADE